MIRLDKFLSDMGMGTRKEVKGEIRKGAVSVDGNVIRQPAYKLDEKNMSVTFRGKPCVYEKYGYYMLHKPAGVISATRDRHSASVVDLLGKTGFQGLFPVGRLDKDAEGLLLITNDGMLAHRLLAPTRHVDKTYRVVSRKALSREDIDRLQQGVDIGEKRLTLPARIQTLSDTEYLITVCEGKYHQIKRMLQAVGNEVISLKRLAMGSLRLDESLLPGQFRPLTAEEISALRQCGISAETEVTDGIRAVIFDMDGTLVDSMWLWYDIDVEYLGRFGLQCPPDLQEAIEGMSFSETAAYFKERFHLPDDLEQIKADWNRMVRDKYLHEVPLKEGVYDFLCRCRERGLALGIATSSSRELVESVVKVHGLADFFSCIITGCDVSKGKPAPDIYLKAAEKLGISPAQCLVFEDVAAGIRAGKDAGMRVCAVEDAYSAYQMEEKQELADYYIENYRDIVKGR